MLRAFALGRTLRRLRDAVRRALSGSSSGSPSGSPFAGPGASPAAAPFPSGEPGTGIAVALGTAGTATTPADTAA